MSARDSGHAAHTSHEDHGGGESLAGLALSGGDLFLAEVTAPTAVGEAGELRILIRAADGSPVTAFTTTHERGLHVIVVRSDGREFHHAHPTLDAATGTWVAPWEWSAAGSYRVFADFTTESGTPLTLARTIEVAGDYVPVAARPSRVSEVGGYTVELAGDLVAGASRELVLSVSRDGVPITSLEPYLGAFGHLIALREGDLAFLHIHAEEEATHADQRSGPALVFMADAPTAGRYLLYLDFQVAGEVRTATFVLDADG